MGLLYGQYKLRALVWVLGFRDYWGLLDFFVACSGGMLVL